MNIKEFETDLIRFRDMQRSPDSGAVDDQTLPAAETALSIEMLQSLSQDAKGVHEQMKTHATALREQLYRDWPGNPLISRASLFGPLGLANKEVRWTKSIAWMVTPGVSSSPLRREAHRVLIEKLLEIPLVEKDAEHWIVEDEHFVCSDEMKGRIDIYLEGHSGNKLYRVGIEAKVQASESHSQLSKYQTALEVRKPEGNVRMAFLTPTGKVASTGDQSVRPIAYDEFLKWMLLVLKDHPEDEAAPFVHLLLADMARDLCKSRGIDHRAGSSAVSIRLMQIANDFLGNEGEHRDH